MGEANRSRERRWIVLDTAGRFVTLGRASDPSDEEVREAERALKAQGLSGWLAVMEGNPYVGVTPRLLAVRPLADPASSFADAAASCVQAIAERRVDARS